MLSAHLPMSARVSRVIALSVLAAAGAYGLWRYEQHRSEVGRLQEEVRRLEEQRQHLQRFVSRLTAERRVAEIIVTEQKMNGDKPEWTTLLFLEYARDGTRLPPRFFTIKGNEAHIDALVITFEDHFIEQGDPLRGHSILLFYRLYGAHQTPAEGFPIDERGQAPAIYRPTEAMSPTAQEFESQLWQSFWKLADDQEYRKSKGVKVAQGLGPWTYFYPDRIYTISHSATGNLSIVARPIDGIWQEYRKALTAGRGQ